MDKVFLLEQLGERLRAVAQLAHRSHTEAKQDARSGADRAVNLAKGQAVRNLASRQSLEDLSTFRPRPFSKGEPIALGAVVEVEVEDGDEGRTLFIAPVGAGEELDGPGGDGLFQVVTPASPFGRALLGKRLGDVVEVPMHGDVVTWEITHIA